MNTVTSCSSILACHLSTHVNYSQVGYDAQPFFLSWRTRAESLGLSRSPGLQNCPSCLSRALRVRSSDRNCTAIISGFSLKLVPKVFKSVENILSTWALCSFRVGIVIKITNGKSEVCTVELVLQNINAVVVWFLESMVSLHLSCYCVSKWCKYPHSVLHIQTQSSFIFKTILISSQGKPSILLSSSMVVSRVLTLVISSNWVLRERKRTLRRRVSLCCFA